MISLKPVSEANLNDFDGTEYESMSPDDKLLMIRESINKNHENRYFEIMTVCDDDLVVGFMNLYALSAHIISIGPSIKQQYRQKGYGCQGETLALQYAKTLGYTLASARVKAINRASIALHEKLGFETGSECFNKNGEPVRVYMKNL